MHSQIPWQAVKMDTGWGLSGLREPDQSQGLGVGIWSFSDQCPVTNYLAGGLEQFLCSIIYGIILPIGPLTHIFQDGWNMLKPPTSYTTTQLVLSFDDRFKEMLCEWVLSHGSKVLCVGLRDLRFLFFRWTNGVPQCSWLILDLLKMELYTFPCFNTLFCEPIANMFHFLCEILSESKYWSVAVMIQI